MCNYVRRGGLMGSTRSRKKHKKKTEDKPIENWGKELNIKYHDANSQWNYTIFPKSTSKQAKKSEK
jgi:hypothetical protein